MKEELKYTYIALVAVLLNYNRSAAQQLHKEYNVYNGETTISAPLSVTLKDGFYIPSPPSGTSVRIFTTGITYLDCRPFSATPPSSNRNYILSRIFKIAGVNANTINNSRNTCEENKAIQYFDGLGRPSQTILVKGSPGFNDLVQPYAYDNFGREAIKYEPYTLHNNNGTFRSNALMEQLSFYTNQGASSSIMTTNSPFSVTVFEPSPLNRITEQGALGDAWQPGNGHTLRTGYMTNSEEEVKLWTININNDGANATYYDLGLLYKNIMKDENWVATDGKAGITEEFKDLQGRIIMNRIWETNEKSLDTYYVYDDFGNLRYVLPPAVNKNTDRLPSALDSFNESQTIFNDFILGYHYDGRGRLVEKKIPGKHWQFIVYNKLDKVVLTQDANQRNRSPKEWSFIKYDVLGRQVITGTYNDNADRMTLEATLNEQATLWETRSGTNYEGLSFPQTGADIHTVSYYDDYDFDGNNFGPPSDGQASGDRTKGLLTGSKVKTLGSNTYLHAVNYYDNEGRMIQIKSQNHLTGTDIVNNTFNFEGELTSSKRTHTVTSKTTTIANRYEYDHSGKKIATFEKIDDGDEITLSRMIYNELGQLKEKRLHNELQINTISYNERGWLKNINSSEFSMNLKYNEGAQSQYNGNISSQVYNNGTSNSFSYSYDKLNRLTTGAATGMSEVLTYDVMGNIKTLNRDHSSANQYNYTGSRLNSVNNLTGAYAYDANGNAIVDGRNGITFTYNSLNLPQTASKKGVSLAYTYDANGKKLKKQSSITGTTDYVDGIQYKSNGNIDFIQNEEGIAQNNGSNTYSYRYNLSDHLGNVRHTFDIYNGAVRRLQQDDYYAFGLRKSISPVSLDNKYLYNDKELQEELGQYDYGVRFYDPVIGRWNVIDPKAELLEMSSPYVYSLNSPVNFIDKDGELPIYINGKTSSDSERATHKYWNAELLRTIANSGIPNPGGTPHYVDGNRYLYRLANDVRVKNSGMTEGQTAEGRREAGYKIGKEDFQNVLAQLARDPKTGKITEKIQIYTHSRGAAFGAGYTNALLEMIKQNSSLFADANHVIDYVLNLAPHQSDAIDAPEGANSFSIDHNWDMLSGDDMGNNIGFKTNTAKGSPGLSHQNKSFAREVGVFIQSFQKNDEDNDELIDDFTKRMRSYGIKVTVN